MEFEVNIAFTFPLVGFEIYKIFFQPGYSTRPRHWFCAICSLCFLHYFMAVVQIGIYFIFTNFFINIKQKYYLVLMNKFIELKSYNLYRVMLKKCLVLTDEINVFNAFYSKYISVITLCYGIIGCSVLNAAANSPEVPLVLLMPWVLFSMMYLICIFLFTAVSSKTMLLNRLIFFKLRALQISLCDLKIVTSARRIVHLELVNEYKILLLRTCFRLVTSSPLNNKLFFFQIFGFVSVIYLKTLSRKE